MKTMCYICGRGTREPHAQNCPVAYGGIQTLKSDWRRNDRNNIRRAGAYLRRGRQSSTVGQPFPNILYLVELRQPDPDTPAALYHERDQKPQYAPNPDSVPGVKKARK